MNPETLIATLRRRHRVSSAELLADQGVSRATLMRQVRAAGSAVLTIGRARRTSYAARRLLRGSDAPLPVFRIDQHANSQMLGQLHLAYPDACLLEFQTTFDWPLDADMRDGWFEGIPYPLQDLRPEGFLGRAYARGHASLLQVSEDPRAWSDDDVLYALSLLGSDQSGDCIVGEPAYRRWLERQQSPLEAVPDAQRAAVYPGLAQNAMDLGLVGSSAGGEFPKFTCLLARNGDHEHVIVKFSGQDDTPGTRRWSDLLVCEHLAARCVARLPGLNAAGSRLLHAAGRCFLEVTRFDRHGAHGRSPLCSWAAVNGAWFGLAGRPWTEGAARLLERDLIDRATRDAIARLWHFGRLIGNTDMHDGNLAFVPGGAGLALAPCYDMLPMLYAPQRGVELPVRDFAPALPLPYERDPWHEAAALAIEFWSDACHDARISETFRQTCARNAEAVERAAALAGGGPCGVVGRE